MRLTALPCLLAVAVVCASCFGGGPRAPRDAPDALGSAFLAEAQQHDWYLTGGGSDFYRLAPLIDSFWLLGPEHASQIVVELTDTHHLGSFDVHPEGSLIAVESVPYELGLDSSVPSHLVVWDLALATVYADAALRHFDIQSPYRWTPDGSALVYVQGSTVHSLDWGSEQTTPVVTDHKPAVRDGQLYTTPSFSPDVHRMVYQTGLGELVLVGWETDERQTLGKGKVPV
ncbi:MAG: hypothetical protein GY898_04695 [Proteobacteria bacterium]|nr:hypothetical protein [Pseudomonadota bacterium]